jgi:photosystem II stability/assembly factor-like uncharacterized protein
MKKLKQLILILLFVCVSTEAYSVDYWLTLNTPTTRFLRTCYFLDSLSGWAAGDSGTIIHTTDGGLNWILQDTDIDEDHINDIFFLNENLGWALAWDITFDTSSTYGTIILKTTNGGTNWESKRYAVNDIFINTIIFLDSLNGFMGGVPQNLIKTTNGGVNWFECQKDSNVVSGFPVAAFSFYNPRIGYASGGYIDIAGVIWKTTNYGQFWESIAVGPEPVNGMKIFDSLTVLGVGGDFEYGAGIVKTTNGGVNWNYESLFVFGIAFTVSFRTDEEGWAPLGFSQQWIYTLDSGKSWDTLSTPDSSMLYDVQFTDYRNGFAVGEGGVVLKYNSEVINISNNQNILPAENTLYQNYPNPFNPSTVISYSLSHTSYVVLRIYDLLGREIIILKNDVQKTGHYIINFSASNLPSGVYFYTLLTRELNSNNPEESVITRKMVLVR